MMRTSWRPALEKLAERIEAARPLTSDYGLGDRFRHEPSSSLEQLPAPRSFFFGLEGGNTLEAASVGPFRRRKVVHAYVMYRLLGSPFELLVVLGEDADEITRSLLAHEHFDEAKTGLVDLGGTPDLITWTVQQPTKDAVLLDLRIPVHHIDIEE